MTKRGAITVEILECPLCNYKHIDERLMAIHFWRVHGRKMPKKG